MADSKGNKEEKLLFCSFCGKNQNEVRKLIAGPSVYICNECIDLCNDIIQEEINETVEEATQSLYPLIGQNGMDWMYANCSTTAQRGALDWAPKFRDTLKPVIEECYQKVLSGEEARRSIESNSKSDYRVELEKELNEVNNQEMWIAGKQLRQLRPENL